MEQKLKDAQNAITTLEKENGILEKQISSTEHTKTKINNLLKSYGFTNFKLGDSSKKGCYTIIRQNGDVVKDTLSEGEKTFITFLYFYELVKGSHKPNSTSEEKIIVFDDPISSLDSDILFIVSHLIRELIKEVLEKNTKSNVKQIIILTHNIYFHKEVSYGYKNYRHSAKFWILKKKNDISNIIEYEDNPISTSYELLWKEVKENSESITIGNTIRRIIEMYFNTFGSIDNDKILENFKEEDKIIAGSLLKWSNANSHVISDDDMIIIENDKMLEVFKDIFKNSGSLS